MSIIKNYQEGKTELNKLKFKPNMGGSHPGNPPLIQKRVPTESREASPLAGTELGRRLDDVGRIGQLFARKEGLGFLLNNTTLHQSPSLANNQQPQNLSQLSRSLVNSAAALPKAAKDTLLTLVSTLASIPVSGTGTHFIKGSLGLIKYLDRDGVTLNNPNFLSKIERDAASLPNKGADPRIKSHFYPRFDLGVTRVAGTPPDFASNPENWKNSYEIQKNTTNIPSNDRTRVTISMGEPGTSKVKYDKDGLFYDRESDKTAIDNINAKQPFTDTSQVEDDYVRFLFEILPIDRNADPTLLQFRSFIDSFDDSYTGDWVEKNYIGRGETFYNYRGFRRSVNVSFKSAAGTRAELLPLYEKLNFLASSTAPSYSTSQDAPGIMRGTVVRMTIGNYIFDTPGFISSVNYSWRTGYQWEIKDNVLPHILDCTLSFTPIHTFVPTVLSNKFIATNE